MLKERTSDDGEYSPVDGNRKTRRAALCALVGASALAIATTGSIGSALDDPIFAAIERHLAARKAIEVLYPTIDVVAAERRGREVSQADFDAFDRTSALEVQMLAELLATPPATIAGLRAAVDYLTGFEDGYLSESVRPFFATLLKSPLFDGLKSNA